MSVCACSARMVWTSVDHGVDVFVVGLESVSKQHVRLPPIFPPFPVSSVSVFVFPSIDVRL